jgi:hypothetical protein
MNMERRFKSIKIFSTIAILSMILFSVYFYCLDLTEENLFPTRLLYKNLEQDDLTNDLQKESKVFAPSNFTKVFLFEASLLWQSPHIPFQVSLQNQRAFVLRC